MLPYWILFAYFAIGSLFAHPRLGPVPKFRSFPLAIGLLGMILMIGTRYRVGLDWAAYDRLFRRLKSMSFGEAVELGDPAHSALNWLVQSFDGPFWIVNLVCAAIFGLGLSRLVRTQPEPWTAVLIAVPYLVVVVAMGYTRQAAAIGFVMMSLAALFNGRSIVVALAGIFAGATFHSSAVVALPLILVGVRSQTLAKIIVAPTILLALYSLTLDDNISRYQTYIQSAMQSQGAQIRVILCLIPAILCLAFGRRLALNDVESGVLKAFSITALGLMLLLIVTPWSTAIDRIALYLIPLQIAVLGRSNLLLGHYTGGRLAAIGYSGAILFVWLNFAQFSYAWKPYRSYFSPNFKELSDYRR